MNGVTQTATQVLQAATGTPWKVVATGDFNADGKPDIVWENFAKGQVYVWFMSSTGTAAIWGGPGGAFAGDFIRDGSANIISLGATTMRVVGSADIDVDGDADLVWQDQETGALRVWSLSGTTRTSDVAVTPPAVNPDWQIRSVGDYNADGRADFIFQHTSGALYAWFMNGASLARGTYLSPAAVKPEWELVGPR
jgi:hypothetical protein